MILLCSFPQRSQYDDTSGVYLGPPRKFEDDDELSYLHRGVDEEAEEEEVANRVQSNNNQCPSPDDVHIDPISGIYIGDIVEERDLKEAKLTDVTRKLVGLTSKVHQGGKKPEEERSCLPARWRGIELVKQKGRPEWF